MDCDSCGAELYGPPGSDIEYSNTCRGCGRLICTECCRAFDHMDNGAHREGDPRDEWERLRAIEAAARDYVSRKITAQTASSPSMKSQLEGQANQAGGRLFALLDGQSPEAEDGEGRQLVKRALDAAIALCDQLSNEPEDLAAINTWVAKVRQYEHDARSRGVDPFPEPPARPDGWRDFVKAADNLAGSCFSNYYGERYFNEGLLTLYREKRAALGED